MLLKRKIIKSAAALLSAGFIGLFGMAGYYSLRLPSAVTVETGKAFKIAEYPELSCSASFDGAVPAAGNCADSEQVTLSLFGVIPVKNVEVRRAEAPVFTLGGRPFGIKLLMEGVMVTDLDDVEDETGVMGCPAKKAGICTGDIIRLADGEAITSNDALQAIISSSGGKAVKLSVERSGRIFSALLQPVFSRKCGCYKGGMWVRDSIAGIGTMSFFDKSTGCFAGLGHPVCDSDTGGIVPIHSGEAVPIEITDVRRGAKGSPGELRGSFAAGESFGVLDGNKTSGIYGKLTPEALEELSAECDEFTMAYSQDIREGPAEIYTTVSGEKPQRYSAVIERVDYGSSDSKNMVIRITDKRLLEATGGIVQGMSGSPVIQDGRLAGAVTHVFVADPSRGYGIFAENMAQGMY